MPDAARNAVRVPQTRTVDDQFYEQDSEACRTHTDGHCGRKGSQREERSRDGTQCVTKARTVTQKAVRNHSRKDTHGRV